MADIKNLINRPAERFGTGTVCSPVALRLPGLRVSAVFGLVARSDALEAVALAPFVPGGAVLTGATGKGRCLGWLPGVMPGGCGTGTVCSPVALRLPGLRVSAVFGLVARNDVCEYL
jgi:hypothetical protein